MPTYDPFKDLQNFVNQAFTTGGRSLAMPMDLFKRGEDYIAQIDLPGVDPESIDIDVDDRTITIRAERRHADTEKQQGWVTRERSFGTYARQITVGSGLALDRITADYTDGVLTLTIPVAEEAKPRKVQVQRGTSRSLGSQTEGQGDVVPGQVEESGDQGDSAQQS